MLIDKRTRKVRMIMNGKRGAIEKAESLLNIVHTCIQNRKDDHDKWK